MSDRLTEDVTKFQGRFTALKAEVGKVLVGQDDMLHRLPPDANTSRDQSPSVIRASTA